MAGYLMKKVGGGLYGLVGILDRYESRIREQNGPTLGEPFLADVVRGMYRTLEFLRIPDPATESFLEEIAKNSRVE